MAERFGFGALDDEGVEPPTAEEQALLDELDEDPPQYLLTPEEQAAEGVPPFPAVAAPGQTDATDIPPLPNGLHELPADEADDDGEDEDDTDDPDEGEDYY
jgi:hypothetical protein